MSVYKNCYLYRSNRQVLIDVNGNPDCAKKFHEGRLSYIYNHNQELKSVRDERGNYYYLAEDCRKIQ